MYSWRMHRASVWWAVAKMVVMAVMAVIAVGCGDDRSSTGSPVAGIPDELQPIAQEVLAAYEGIDPDAPRLPAVYRYPDELVAGDEILNVQGDVIATASGPAILTWVDLFPLARFSHPGQLTLTDPATGAILDSVETTLWPSEVAGQPWDPFTSDAIVPAVDPDDVVWTLEGEGNVLAERAGALTTPSSSACSSRRLMFQVRGTHLGAADFYAAQEGDKSTMDGVASAMGATTVPVGFTSGGTSVAAIKQALKAENLTCCDEVIFYYTGHGFCGSGDLQIGGADMLSPADLAGLVNGSKACKWLVILDSCHSGQTAQKVKQAVDQANRSRTSNKGVTIVAATTADDTSSGGVVNGKNGGVFTTVAGGAISGSGKSSYTWNEAVGAWVGQTGKTLKGTLGGAKIGNTAAAWAGWLVGKSKDWIKANGMVYDQKPNYQSTGVGADCCECGGDHGPCPAASGVCKASFCNQGLCEQGNVADGCDCAVDGEDLPTCRRKVCKDGACVEEITADAVCDDEDECTETDRCDAEGECKGTEITCPDDGKPCTIDECEDGVCHTPKPPLTVCKSGPTCWVAGECDAAGKCIGEQPLDALCVAELSAAQIDCTKSECTTDGCEYTAKTSAVCVLDGAAGHCKKDPAGVPADATGTVGVCQPAEGPCKTDADCAWLEHQKFGVQTTTAAYNDQCGHVECVIPDGAQQGVCDVVFEPYDTPCNKGNPCADYVCSGTGYCNTIGFKEFGAPEGCDCDPAVPAEEQCQPIKDELGEDKPCVVLECVEKPDDPETGWCAANPADAECDPGEEHCWTGSCTVNFECLPASYDTQDLKAKPDVCEDDNPCTTDGCVGPAAPNADAAGCEHVCPSEDEQSCGDGDEVCLFTGNGCPCTEPCSDDAECDDGDECTAEVCGDSGYCEPIEMAADASAPKCDDGDPCTTDDTCENGACAGTPLDCEQPEAECMFAACNPETLECEVQPWIPSYDDPGGAAWMVDFGGFVGCDAITDCYNDLKDNDCKGGPFDGSCPDAFLPYDGCPSAKDVELATQQCKCQ